MTLLLGKLIRFGIIGTACAVLFFAVNYALLNMARLSTAAALVLTYAICFGIGYYLQRNVAFRATLHHRKSLPRYFAMHVGGMIFVYLMTVYLSPLFAAGSFGPSLITTALAGMVSFVISLSWVFRESSELR